MAMASRIRAGFSLIRKTLNTTPQFAETLSPVGSSCNPIYSHFQQSRNYTKEIHTKEPEVKVPLVLFGVPGKYATALFSAAAKSNCLDKVESDILNLVEASKKSPLFSQFIKDPSVPAETKVKAVQEIASEAGFSEITKNFLAVAAQNRRLGLIEKIVKCFTELTMAYRGEVKAVVTTVIPLPEQEEKELKETLQDVIGHGKTVKLEQKIDQSIMGGIVVEFAQKVFDMSIRTRAKQMEKFLRDPVNFENF
ncbi:ATP synthase subunit O, mitochondrial isoform X1 [Amborella trichopoda]|uniref:ATP synthase subunit O, mitochondrial n=1 Tax=Amborella trichopoda TaxID=13333 RepID=W1PUQ9_AMBTC|nr:ATP synthase subunit O, mitochondrial isoform X1 [Amborella trichopoda]ERN11793.1 hypothetical protein AMTR_s00022p00252000 [Amborella trichopoda]|eukprot:XP_006850212.1 ATP synthase subunit O, mitochondrial isoform X1 [Amborella trichopoda]